MLEAPTLDPIVQRPQAIADDLLALAAWMPIPDQGLLACNAFVLRAAQPILVDTAIASLRDSFMASLRDAIDPAELRWIWLSHTDADHIGNLTAVLEAAPQARVVTSFLGLAKMNLLGLPLDRVDILPPDTPLDLGDRLLMPLRPPYYDAPETTGFFDTRRRTLFCVDSFGALLQKPAETAGDISIDNLRDGLLAWAGIDAPWLEIADRTALEQSMQDIVRLNPATIISAHLPVARGVTERLARIVTEAYCRRPAADPARLAVDRLAA